MYDFQIRQFSKGWTNIPIVSKNFQNYQVEAAQLASNMLDMIHRAINTDR